MDLLNVVKPSSGIDAELTVGDKSEEINTQLGNKEIVTNNAEQVGDRVEKQINITENIPLWLVLLLILGWIMPTPTNIWRGFVKGFKLLWLRKE
jgi:hypothetical protein